MLPHWPGQATHSEGGGNWLKKATTHGDRGPHTTQLSAASMLHPDAVKPSPQYAFAIY